MLTFYRAVQLPSGDPENRTAQQINKRIQNAAVSLMLTNPGTENIVFGVALFRSMLIQPCRR